MKAKDKKKVEKTVIKEGEPIMVEAPTREEASLKVWELRQQAEKAGLIQVSGGFVYDDDDGTFRTSVTFDRYQNI